MRKNFSLFSVLTAFCLMLSCFPWQAVAQGGPGGGGGGNGGGGQPGITLAAQLSDIWVTGPNSSAFFKLTLNANSSFTLTRSGTGATTTVQGNWTLGPVTNSQPFSNQQGFLTLISRGQVLLSGNVLLVQPDLFEMFPTTNNLSTPTPQIVFAKATP